MKSRSRSRSITPRRSSRSPYMRSRRRSRNPTSPPRISSSRKSRRYSSNKRSPSRSKSSSYKKRYNSRRHTRSRSRTKSGSRSRSPSRNSYVKSSRYSRDNPPPSRCIGVFGLNVHTTQHQIREIFEKFGYIERIHVVVDVQTGFSRGFCFIYYENLADAKAACDNCCGMDIGGRRIRVAYSVTGRPHTPTPGVYKGQSAKALRKSYRNQQRNNSPYSYSKSYRHRYERSRSRSYSPRRYRH